MTEQMEDAVMTLFPAYLVLENARLNAFRDRSKYGHIEMLTKIIIVLSWYIAAVTVGGFIRETLQNREETA